MTLTECNKAFHAHLDVCQQCRNNPFGLCKRGEALLLAWSEEDAVNGMRKILGAMPTGSEGGA